jgi:hypothetical protein
MIVTEMALRGGINTAEFEQYEQVYNARLKAPGANTSEVIN